MQRCGAILPASVQPGPGVEHGRSTARRDPGRPRDAQRHARGHRARRRRHLTRARLRRAACRRSGGDHRRKLRGAPRCAEQSCTPPGRRPRRGARGTAGMAAAAPASRTLGPSLKACTGSRKASSGQIAANRTAAGPRPPEPAAGAFPARSAELRRTVPAKGSRPGRCGVADYVAAAAVIALGVFRLVHHGDDDETRQASRLNATRGLAIVALGRASASTSSPPGSASDWPACR